MVKLFAGGPAPTILIPVSTVSAKHPQGARFGTQHPAVLRHLVALLSSLFNARLTIYRLLATQRHSARGALILFLVPLSYSRRLPGLTGRDHSQPSWMLSAIPATPCILGRLALGGF